MSRKSGIVNVRMVITEEKILSNIDKVQKLINPKSKKQIVQLEDDTYFKDLIESIKAYLIEYPKKKNFPVGVYKAAYGLVEYATIQFEENTKKVEELIRQREENIALAGTLRELVDAVEARDPEWKEKVEENKELFSEDVIDTLKLVGKDKSRRSQNYKDAIKLLNARVNNLETNLHIEIDLERTEDRSKALSYIGIEVADALKDIPRPADLIIEETEEEEIQEIEEVQAPKTQKVQKAQEIEKVEKVAKATKAGRKKKTNVELVEEVAVEANEENTEAETEKVANIQKAKTTKGKASNKQIIEEEVVKEKKVSQVVAIEENDEEEQEIQDMQEYQESVVFEKKPSLWQRIKNSKLGRAISYVCRIRIRIELPDALPEGRGE